MGSFGTLHGPKSRTSSFAGRDIDRITECARTAQSWSSALRWETRRCPCPVALALISGLQSSLTCRSSAVNYFVRLLLELHDDPVGLLQRTPIDVRVHENNVRPTVCLVQAAAVFVAHVRLGEVNDGRMIEEK